MADTKMRSITCQCGWECVRKLRGTPRPCGHCGRSLDGRPWRTISLGDELRRSRAARYGLPAEHRLR